MAVEGARIRAGLYLGRVSEPGVENEPSLIEGTLAEIQRLYLADPRPWVIGYSGGKDSTASLQLIWTALSALPSESRTKQIYVISGDTLVETPIIIDYLGGMLERINKAARAQSLPISAHPVSPDIEETFWVNLIGRGYPAPSPRFRWCTERMKINPANRFILDRVAEHGEVTVVLGVRRQESATRAQLMSLRAVEDSPLARHTRLPNAFVYAPVRDWSVDDVWAFLLQNQSPWGADNNQLLAMYRSSSQDECPLVVDTTTPSCGSSRFGCWTCTVVSKDKAMEAMIDKGEEWLEPLLELRDFLAATHEPAIKAKVRSHVRKSGAVTRKTSGDIEADPLVRGPYKLEFCQEVLRRLLVAEAEARSSAPEDQTVALISDQELHAIRRIWRFERGDWSDSLPAIVAESSERRLPWPEDDSAAFNQDDEQRLKKICDEAGLNPRLLKSLIDLERSAPEAGRGRRMSARLDGLLGQEWRSESEVLAEIASADGDRS